MLPVLGIHAFEQSPSSITTGAIPVLTCHGRGITAVGNDTPQGFVIQSGSFASMEENPSLKENLPGAVELRNDLKKSGVLVAEGNALRFTQDYTFSSPSFAASVVLGRSSSGRREWKDASGKTLKELQEEQAQG